MTTPEGIPLPVTLTEAHVHDLRQLLTLVLARFPRIGGQRGRPLDRPLSVTTDKGYDCQATRDLLVNLGVEPHIPQRGQADDSSLGQIRWPVQRTLSWLKQFRRLRICWDRLDEMTQAFLDLACSLIIWRNLVPNQFCPLALRVFLTT